MFKSMIIAFSTYSKIPMPKTEWNEKSMRFSMCFFPFVGAVIGGLSLALYYLTVSVLGCSEILSAAVLTCIPVLVTGGIHVDGFLDTIDAKSSYKDADEKLRILKDPHTGAFAIIYGIVYFVLYFGFMYELIRERNILTVAVMAIGHIYVRAMSGLSVVLLRKAKKDGMIAASADAAPGIVKWIMVLWILLCAVAMALVDVRYGIVAVLAGLVAFIYYRNMAYRTFGGITGDLAGYFLQLAKLMILMTLVIVMRI